MKKNCFSFILFVFCALFLFGNSDKGEEVDFLLFMPNSGTRFANEEKAFVQLNNLALYLSNKNILPGQIIVYGYAAYAPNDIKSVDLSKERALTVMEELQKRGISKELFADPVGYGEVYLWGNNTDENDRKPNRRVRVLLDGESLMPVTNEIISAETAPHGAAIRNPVIANEKPFAPKYISKGSNFKFPWWLILLLALLLLLFFLFRGRSRKQVQTKNKQSQIPAVENRHDFTPKEAVTTWMVNLDEEIRLRAYELSLERGGSGDYREQDWYNAVQEISAWYTACGHSVFTDGGYWWASRTHSYDFPAVAVS